MVAISSERLASVFVAAADTLVDDFDLVEFLQVLTSQCSEVVSARATGLLLADGQGRLQLMAASDERTEMIELFQVQSVEGPCQDCFRQGVPVSTSDLRQAHDRWPRFAPGAVEAGFISVHAFPMRLRGEIIGALNLFGDEPGSIAGADATVVQALADIATIGLLHERAVRESETVRTQLQLALDSRVVIEQAKGALAQIHGGTPDQAFERLRSYCRRHGLRLTKVARAVTEDPRSLPDLTTPSSSA